ncbi:lyase family protein [Sporosarcina sp. FSL K6-1522]|uniref:lyase family protein n=1 Tax=Sporosarcina sp. FSL K6-1522 TaxID=2921554 RepID=UPI00315AC1B5
MINREKLLETRQESDAFGVLEVPNDALYGIQTSRSIQNLSFSGRMLKQYPGYIKSLATVKKAAALANCEAGVIDHSIADAIIHACDELLMGKDHEHFLIDVLHGGGGIATNMNVNEVIANRANEWLKSVVGSNYPVHPTDHVNASQSTSDVCHTAMRLAIIQYYSMLEIVLIELENTMSAKAQQFMDVPTISRTCMQDGMRIQLGETFGGYAAVVKRRHESLRQAILDISSINLGGTVIGSGVGAPLHYRQIVVEKLCEISGVALHKRENLFDAAQNLDDLGNISKQLSLLASSLIKIAKDLRLLASGPEAGLSEIYLPEVQAGSSFFPGKINPVIPETLIQSCFQVLGCDRVVQAALEHGELDLNIYEGAAGINILDAMMMLEKSLSLFTAKCFSGIEANVERCEVLANGFIPIVVELKEKYGYSSVSKWVKEKSKEEIKAIYKNGGAYIDES